MLLLYRLFRVHLCLNREENEAFVSCDTSFLAVINLPIEMIFFLIHLSSNCCLESLLFLTKDHNIQQ